MVLTDDPVVGRPASGGNSLEQDSSQAAPRCSWGSELQDGPQHCAAFCQTLQQSAGGIPFSVTVHLHLVSSVMQIKSESTSIPSQTEQ